MKRIKCAIFDSISINDMNLVLRHEIVEVPDEIFYSSVDLKKAIAQGFVICEGINHKGSIYKFGKSRSLLPDISPQNDVHSVNSRLSILERSVGDLLTRDYETPSPKYLDHMIYANTFSSSEYDALIFDAFIDTSKRHETIPGDMEIRKSNLYNDNSTLFSIFNSKKFTINEPIAEIMPMARWNGDGIIRMYVKVGGQDIQVLSENTNKLWSAISVDKANTISVTIVIKPTYNVMEFYSYGILLKF